MPSFQTIRSVERTIAVLRAMNSRTVSRVADLQDVTGLPAATIVRILETLVDLGYVQHLGRRSGYALTEKVLDLSAGYHGLPLFLERAKQVLLDLTHSIRWSAALATLGDTSMIVRLSTIPESPLAHTHSTLQKQLDLLGRAHGRAYLAYCPEEERQHLFKRLHEDKQTLLASADLDARMRPILAQVRHLGYAERDHDIDPQTTTIAMPVMVQNQLRATVGVTFFRGARANRRDIVAHLKDTATRLQQSVPDA